MWDQPHSWTCPLAWDRLVGLVVKASASWVGLVVKASASWVGLVVKASASWVGLVVKASASWAAPLGSIPDLFPGLVRPVTEKISNPVAGYPGQAPGLGGSTRELVGLVSVCCRAVREKVWSANSISVWQRVQLSERICPRTSQVCCRDVKRPTHNNHHYCGDSVQFLPSWPMVMRWVSC